MWRGVRQQLVRLGSVVDLTSPVAATLQQLPNATTASPLTAAIAYVPVATKKTDASRIGKPRYDPAEYKQMMIDYRQRLKKWRKELLAEVGAAQAEAERLRKEKLEAQRAFTAQCYQQRQERKAANRAQFERDHAEYMVAKVGGECVGTTGLLRMFTMETVYTYLRTVVHSLPCCTLSQTMYDTQVTEYRRAKADLYARMHMQKYVG